MRRGLLAAALLFASACAGSPTDPRTLQPFPCRAGMSAEPCDVKYTVQQLPRLADTPPCPSREDIEAIDRDIPVNVKSDPTAGTLGCRAQDGSLDLTWAQKRVYQALLYLKGLRFDAPLPWTGASVYDWLRAAIPNGIIIDSTGSSRSCMRCPGPIYIVPLTSGQRVADQNASIVDTPFEVIVHEGRHADGWGHSCSFADRTVQELGPVGVQYRLVQWIATHSDQPATVRQWAVVRANILLQYGFCCECGAGEAGNRPRPPFLVMLPPCIRSNRPAE